MLSRRCQLADVIVYRGESTVKTATELATTTLAALTGCVLVVVEVTGHGVLLAARPAQRVIVPPREVMQVAIEAYGSLLHGDGNLLRRSASSPVLGSPLAE
jgi:hypothetical protein